MKILATGEMLRLVGVSRDRYLWAERTGRICKAKLTSAGKRYFLPEDVRQLKRELSKKPRLDTNPRSGLRR